MYRMGQEEIDAVARVIESKQLFKVNSGDLQETYNCEKEMRERFGSEYAILMTSGQAALISALIGMGIGPGDQVLVPAYTYIATALSVLAVGAIPIVCEIDESLMLDPDDIEKKLTAKTKAVIPVHMQGHPCDMDKICEIAKKHNLLVLEDACQAVGGSYKGKSLGSIGDAGAFSFNYYKTISAGEGGALLTGNKAIFEKSLIYHDSSAVKYFGDQLDGISIPLFGGTEFRTNEIPAAILRVQMKRLDGILSDLRRNKNKLRELLSPYYKFVPLNDKDGDCATQLALKFDSAEEAMRVAKHPGVGMMIPFYLGKHVYNDWEPVLNKRGAAHPLMNPYEMEVNKGVEYSADMCAKSLEILKKAGFISINPEWTDEDIEKVATPFIEAAKA